MRFLSPGAAEASGGIDERQRFFDKAPFAQTKLADRVAAKGET